MYAFSQMRDYLLLATAAASSREGEKGKARENIVGQSILGQGGGGLVHIEQNHPFFKTPCSFKDL